MDVSALPLLHFGRNDVYVFTLTPSGSPSGVIALKSVREGQVETLDALRFPSMEGTGTVALEVSPHGLDVSWNIPPASSDRTGGTVFLTGSGSGVTISAGGTYGPSDQEGERIIWSQSRYSGEPPMSDSDSAGELAALVSESQQRPERTTYCLTLRVGGK